MARTKDAVALDWLEEAATEALEQNDPEQMAWALDLVRHVKGHLADIEAGLVQSIAQTVKVRTPVRFGCFEVECTPGGSRKRWQSDRLLGHIDGMTKVDDTGELLDPTDARERLLGVLRDCVPFTQSLGWRAGGLKAHGIDPSEWSEFEPGKPRVQVREVTDGV